MDEIDYKLIELENKQLRAENERLKREFKPIVRAEWRFIGCDVISNVFSCSKCGKAVTTEAFEKSPLENDIIFCCRCGARMDGEE